MSVDTAKLRYFPRGCSTNFSLAHYPKMLPVTDMMHDAADELDSLRDQVYTLREALADARANVTKK